MRDRIEILSGVKAANPKTFLTGRFETGIVSFGFGAHSVDFLERNTFAVNGKTVIVRQTQGIGEPDPPRYRH